MIKERLEFYKWPAVIAIVFLLLSFLSWPYGYYTFMKFVVISSAIYYAHYIYNYTEKQNFYFWFLVCVIVLFNPVVPVYLGSKNLWSFIDVVIIIFLVNLIFEFKKK